MSRHSILVVGANGTLGRTVLQKLGPSVAIAATRTGCSPLHGFEHASLDTDGAPPADVLGRCRAVINAAGCVKGDNAALGAANIRLPLVIARAAAAAGVSKMVQVSSFSVAGVAERIDEATSEQPINAYGRSKVAGDREILAIAGGAFAVECLRLPFMFSVSKPGLLSTLLTLSDRLGILPYRAGQPFQRSMFTYGDAAQALIACTADSRSGRSYAADPRPFDYAMLKSLLAEEAQRNVRLVTLSEPLVAVVERILPSISRRLFRSNILDSRINRAGVAPLGLERELRLLISARCKH